MPYYYIKIKLNNKKWVNGIKEHHESRIDHVWRIFYDEALRHYRGSEIEDYDCFMISRQSGLYKKWMQKKSIKANKPS